MTWFKGTGFTRGPLSGKDLGIYQGLCKGIRTMSEENFSDDFTLGTGDSHTVRDFVEAAFNEIGITLDWIGGGLYVVRLSNGETMVKVSKEFYSHLESDNYRANHLKAKKKLKWEPKTKFRDLVKFIVKNDLKLYQNQH